MLADCREDIFRIDLLIVRELIRLIDDELIQLNLNIDNLLRKSKL